jgi:Ser/Thr protein kinase RdoA (MazF antagonist)
VDPRWRPAASGATEAALVEDLRRAGAPIVPFRVVVGGGAVMTAGAPRWAICCAAAPGDIRDPPGVEACACLGGGLARLHRAGDGLPGPARHAADGITEDPLAVLAPYWSLWPDAADLPALVARLAQWCRDHGDDRGAIHGDAHTGNCAFASEQVAFFDTECAGYGPRGYDLAVVRATMMRQFPQDVELASRWNAFLDGYRAVRPLSPAAEAMVPACIALRRLWLLLVAARMPWRYERARFQTLGKEACAVIATAVAQLPESRT